jgi:catechol 2,3-dioxygenase-like lactoylglutathione lyase family enzyme
MLANADPIAFVATANAEAATVFYRDVLGLRFVSDDPFALVFDLNGTALRIAKVESVTPVQNTILGWQVDDIEATVRGLTEKGVAFERYPQLDQDDIGIWTSPGARIAWFKDPDGNTLSLTEPLG